jgi:hypothetical protein
MLVVAALTALPAPVFLQAPFNSSDEALLVLYGEELLAGRVPGADFFTVYGPGGFATLAGAFQLFGVSVVVERLVGLGYRLAIVTGVMFLAQRRGSRVSVVAGLVSAVALLPSGLTAYAWFGGLALVIWSIGLLERGRQSSAFVAGVLGGLASAWRIEMIVLNAAALPLIWRDRRAAPYAAGVVLGSLPTVIWLAVAGRVAIENVVLSRMAINAQLELADVPFAVWLMLGLAGALTGFVIVQGWVKRNRRLLALGLLCLLVLPQAVQRIDLHHQVFALCLVLPIGVICAESLGLMPARPGIPRWLIITTRSLAGVVVLVLIFLVGVSVAMTTPVTVVSHEGRAVPVASSKAEDLRQLLDEVSQQVPKGSKLFVGAQDMSVPTLTDIGLYHLLREYEHPWFYLELPPGVAEVSGSPLAEEVSEADALILTDIRDDLRRTLFPHIPAGSDEVNRIVAEQFCLVAQVGRNQIHLRCTDGEGH